MLAQKFEDFYKVPDLKFDIKKLREDLEIVLKKRNFDTPGISHFGAISVNQIPDNEDSIKGHNIRGQYWTIPDETGKEVSRDIPIDESKYTKIVPEFENTYFKEVYETLRHDDGLQEIIVKGHTQGNYIDIYGTLNNSDVR